MIRRTGLAVIALVLGGTSVQAKVIGTFGTTYRITERDALAEIEEFVRVAVLLLHGDCVLGPRHRQSLN